MKKYIITAVFAVFSAISISAQSKFDAQVSKLYQNYIAQPTSIRHWAILNEYGLC